MRICFFAKFDGGGTERATFLLANHLCEYHEVIILSTSQSSPTFFLSGDVSFKHLSAGSILQTIRSLVRFIDDNRIEILVALEALSGICALPAAKLTGCKLVIWDHANYYQTQGCKYIHFVRKLEMLFSDAYVVLTKRDLNNFRSHFPRVRTRLKQIYNLTDISDEREYNAESCVIISAGHIVRNKNFSAIPEIAHIIFRRHPDWKWKIYGSPTQNDGEYERLVTRISEYGLSGKVVLCGRCNDMATAYREAALYVMTSLQEGFPMVLLEAKAHGIPMISFDIETGPDEIIENKKNGFLVRPYDIHEMADRIIELIENKEKRVRFSERNYNSIAFVSSEQIVPRWLTLFSDLKA